MNTQSSSDSIRCTVVGLRQGLENVYVLLNHPAFSLETVCDLDYEPYAWITGEVSFEDSDDQYAGAAHLRPMVGAIRSNEKAQRVGYTSDYQSILADDTIQAVVLIVPDALHESYSLQALRAGKSVLLTKPISNSLSGARTILDEARKVPDRFMLGFQLSYSRFAEGVRGIIDSGTIGDVRQICYQFHRGPFFRPVNRQRKNSGGALIQEGCHYFDLFHRFTNRRFTRVTASGGLHLLGDIQDIQDHGTILVELEDGVQCVFTFSYFRGNPLRDTIAVVGTKGSIRGSIDGIEWEGVDTVGKTGTGRMDFENHRLPHLNHDGYYEMHDAFARMITDREEPYAGWHASLENALISHAAQRSLDTGRTVRRDEMEPD